MLPTLQYQYNVSLSNYTTLKTGGLARYFVTVTTITELISVVHFAAQNELPIRVIGAGSNILASDAGYPGVIIHMCFRGITTCETDTDTIKVTAGAGESLDALVSHTVRNNWWGLENLSDIPGTVGATPIQNVGAYGVEVSDLITAVKVLDTSTGQERMLSDADCKFGYRDSCFKHPAGQRYIITAVTFTLSITSRPRLNYVDLARTFPTGVTSPAVVRDAVKRIRRQKFPDWHMVGTAGSFFKNPVINQTDANRLIQKYPDLPIYPLSDGQVKISLGFVLDKICNLKGYVNGHTGLFKEQALVLVAMTGATSSEIENFANKVSDMVLVKTKIKIEWEVTYLK